MLAILVHHELHCSSIPVVNVLCQLDSVCVEPGPDLRVQPIGRRHLHHLHSITVLCVRVQPAGIWGLLALPSRVKPMPCFLSICKAMSYNQVCMQHTWAMISGLTPWVSYIPTTCRAAVPRPNTLSFSLHAVWPDLTAHG